MALGAAYAQCVKPGAVLCFFGDLGAGKTTFLKGFISAATGCSLEQVSSPTFVLLQSYSGVHTVHHFDLYRLESVAAFCQMGFDELLYGSAICCIEWSERLQDYPLKNSLSREYYAIHIAHKGGDLREITITD